jgi:hypothetical protein
MSRPPKDPTSEIVTEICEKTGKPEGVVRAVLGDLAVAKDAPPGQRWSQRQLAERYGIAFGELTTIRNMGKIAFADIREGLLTKAAIIGNKALDIVMDRMNNEGAVAEMKTADVARIAKMNLDAVRDLSGGGGTGGPVFNINLGEVHELKRIGEQMAARPSLEDRLRTQGTIDEAEGQ